VATCYHCGDEIEFRWVDGALRPIHVNGGWCSGGSERQSSYVASSFETVQSYLDPNARCPVCGDPVFFYRSPYNGRVFFDDVGWPWPKHPCTDKYQGRDNEIRRAVNSRLKFSFHSRDGRPLDVYRMDQLIERGEDLLIRLKNVERGPPVLILVTRAAMREKAVTIEDLNEAPTLLLSRDNVSVGETEVSFMSARLQSVVVLAAAVQPS
jgi:hypothetical protein